MAEEKEKIPLWFQMICGAVIGAVGGGLGILIGALLPLLWTVIPAWWRWQTARNERVRKERALAAEERAARLKYQTWQLELEVRTAAEAARIAALPLPPPPPTRNERAWEAKLRFEETLEALQKARLDEIELRAAKEYEKQKYLRQIAEILG
jgi:hypothetical protein